MSNDEVSPIQSAPTLIGLILGMIEKYRVAAALLIPVAFTLIHSIGFVVMSLHFGSRKIPIQSISIGAKTFLVGIAFFGLIVAMLSVLFCISIFFIRSKNFLGAVFATARHQIALAAQAGQPGLVARLLRAARSREGWRSFSKRNLASAIIAILATFGLYLVATIFKGAVITVFPDLRPIQAFGSVIQFGGILLLMYISPSYFLTDHSSQSSQGEFHEERAMKRAMSVTLITILAAGFVTMILEFAVTWYPNMLFELGGGRSYVATMEYSSEVVCKYDLGPSLRVPTTDDPQAGIPGTAHPDAAACNRIVRIIYEDHESYRISPLTERKPPIIFTVKKEDVALVAVSPD